MMLHAELATVELARRLPIDPRDTINAPRMPRDDELRDLFADGPAFVIMDDGDQVLAIAGAVAQEPQGNAMAYAFVAASAARKTLAVVRALRRLLEAAPFRRLEIVVSSKDERRVRWLGLLGFVREGTARAWAADGSDGERFVRIRDATVRETAEASHRFH
jgi:hypothetical protein